MATQEICNVVLGFLAILIIGIASDMPEQKRKRKRNH